MLAELTRRVQRAIREARAGGAGGEPTRADEKRYSLRERETPFICPESREVAEGPSARAATRSMSGDRFRSDALAAFDDVRRALRDAEVSRTKTRVVRSADSVVVAEENARRPAPAVATGSALVTSLV